MRGTLRVGLAVVMLLAVAIPAIHSRTASATALLADDFTGSSLTGSWLSGGNPNSACLTASMSSSGDIPGCDTETAIDSDGNGALRLTNNSGSQAGFVINQTPISTSEGLQISFDMYQYNGSGADGIAFFLIDGSKNPTQPGAFGGSLGYSNNKVGTPGLVGGYIGVGFDVFGNFSSPDYGTGGPGSQSNTITVRGSESTGYKYVTRASASGSLADNSATDRNDAVRHVTVSISPDNIMSVYVDYNDGSGPIRELNNINLSTVNGAGSLPASLKFGFSASTGGSNNIHEINNLAVTTLPPNVRANAAQNGVWRQGETGQYTITATNDPVAQEASGEITVQDVLSSQLTVTAAHGEGWDCQFTNVHVPTCTRTIDGSDPLPPGSSLPPITVTVAIAQNAFSSISHNTVVNLLGNSDAGGHDNYGNFTVAAGDHDGADSTVESAAPNGGDANDDGTADNQQANVTSFVSAVSGNYVALATSGDCDQNNDPFMVDTAHNSKADSDYIYPIGMMNFSVTCNTPGGTAVITQYYYGDYDPSQFVARKYDSATQTYTDIPGATVEAVTIGGETALKVTYEITDGGPLDADGTANGTIVDPAGPAIKYVAPSSNTSQGGSGSQSSTPGVPNTGSGVYHAQPVTTLIVAGAAATVLASLSWLLAKRYSRLDA